MIVDEEIFEMLENMIANPPKPTQALIDLFKELR